jgi:hypothetical protein
MAFPNLTDITATTIDNRSRKIADNVTKNNALLAYLQKRGNVKPFGGGEQIVQEFSFAENGNTGWYSGYDSLPVAAQDVITGAKFAIKQLAVPVTINGLEELQNSGREQMIDLLDARLEVAENSMANQMSSAIYGDGTGSGGKSLTGLGAAVPLDPTTGTYGGIDRGTWTFWRSQLYNGGAVNAATIQAAMNQLWAKCVRGKDKPDLIVFDNTLWSYYMASLQALQRFTSAGDADLGFASIKYMTADVVLDGGIGGFQGASIGHFLNTKYIFLRPHKDRMATAEFIYLKGVGLGAPEAPYASLPTAFGTVTLLTARDKGAVAISLGAVDASTKYGWFQILGQGVALCDTTAAAMPPLYIDGTNGPH